MFAGVHVKVHVLTTMSLQTQADVSCKRWRMNYNNVNIQLCKLLILINYTQVWVGWTCKLGAALQKGVGLLDENCNYHHLSEPCFHSSQEIALIASAMQGPWIWEILLMSLAPQIAGCVTAACWSEHPWHIHLWAWISITNCSIERQMK